MSTLFGHNKYGNIKDIVTQLTEGTSSICNENVCGTHLNETDLASFADEARKIMVENYSKVLPDTPVYEEMINEDADMASKMFINNIADETALTRRGGLNESVMPTLRTLTASIATTMRTPYEATIHRLFDTRPVDKPFIEIEDVIPTIQAPEDTEAEDLIDAFAPSNPTKFIDKTEKYVNVLKNGVVPGTAAKNLALTTGLNSILHVNRDVRITKIDVTLPAVGGGDPTVVPQTMIRMEKGSVPYFSAKDNTLSCDFIVNKGTEAEPDEERVNVTAKIDFEKNVLVSLNADPIVSKVYFYATISHEEHQYPIKTGFRNSFNSFVVPTRPHIEVSLPQETRTDISNSISHFADVDIITAMTENISVISSRLEDQRLSACMDKNPSMYQAAFNFEAPSNFAYGNLEWLRREFIPFLDQCALRMKNLYNISDCHFRIGVSPYILRIIDTDYTVDKSATEENKGAGILNYSISVKTSTSTFYFISSQIMDNSTLTMNLIPNNFENSQVKTYCYFKYSSFLTDQLRRSDNPVMSAVVYSERNLPVVFQPLSCEVEVTDLPIDKTSGARYIKARA